MAERKLKRRLIYLGVIVAIFVTLNLLKLSPAVCEWWTTTIARGWIYFFGNLSDIFPFSLTVAAVIFAIVLVVVLIVVGIVNLARRNYKKTASGFVAFLGLVMTVFTLYFATAQFAYNRAPVRIDMYDDEISADVVTDIAKFYAEDFDRTINTLPRDEVGRVEGMPFNELTSLLEDEYKRLDSGYFSQYTPKAKQVVASGAMASFSIKGVFFAPFGEANINKITASYDLPMTMAHEMAHSKGVMREKEANLVAFYLLLTSDNDYLRYSAYMNYFREIQYAA